MRADSETNFRKITKKNENSVKNFSGETPKKRHNIIMVVTVTMIEMSKHHCQNIVTETDLPCAIINCCCCKQNAIAGHLAGSQSCFMHH